MPLSFLLLLRLTSGAFLGAYDRRLGARRALVRKSFWGGRFCFRERRLLAPAVLIANAASSPDLRLKLSIAKPAKFVQLFCFVLLR